ncbi:PLP-dependent cysteine synthase family protein [Devosia sp. BK]|uniref:PLP-dependent cysteine synthase family protein n=1 Tax=Devosia sp. BK TaxID=2871706 RepID=UPI00293B7384|nr:PLP-dependent cysteine synthase family protein [Devosia sp. BK]MDV3253652.1 PLP-dependent cysteine synthase family protein [Devosia sp. BK]
MVPEENSESWPSRAIRLLDADAQRSADSHLIPMALPGFPDVDFYFKDESCHPTGSLKHRLARSLILYGLCNGVIGPDTALVEASSGSTAVSEAYYARLLGLKFYAVLPRTTSCTKIEAIEQYGGQCVFVDEPSAIYDEARNLAARTGGHYLDQFTFAERATDWRGNNNIAESIFRQMAMERHPIPRWVVMSPGTGGTSATIGRYILYKSLPTELCVPDPEFSAFYEGWTETGSACCCKRGSRIEGIGRPRMEASFLPNVVDAMLKIPDTASIAAARLLSKRLSRRVGGSTGTNFIGLLWAAAGMVSRNEAGSVVSLICDSGERYAQTYFSDDWLSQQDIDITQDMDRIEKVMATGVFDPALIKGHCTQAQRRVTA